MEILATPGHKLRVAPDFAATNGAFAMNVFEKIERFRISRSLRFHDLHHGRYHFTGFFNHDRVADANVFALNFIFIVQRCARDCAAADKHRFEHGYWRQNPRSSDLHLDIEQLRFDPLGRVFVSNCPAR